MAAKASQESTKPAHQFRFYRAGGVDQVRLDTGADILSLDALDLKLWVALSCPVKGLEFDAMTLALLDEDQDGFVRPPEILAAVRWLRQVIRSADDMAAGKDGFQVSNLRPDTAEGKRVLASSQHILRALGKEQAGIVTVADAMAQGAIFLSARHNGDGCVPPDAIDDPAGKQTATDIIACLGGTTDRSGKPGFDQAMLDRFFAACEAYAAWHLQMEEAAGELLPFGDRTPAAHAAFMAVHAKVDDYFGRCRLAAYDARALNAVNKQETAYLEAAAADLSIDAHEVAHFPLALVEAGKPLPLAAGLNPAWAEAMAAFQSLCAPDQQSMTEAQWMALCARFEGYRKWQAAKTGAEVEPLGIARVRAILAGKTRAVLQQAIADDLAVAEQVATIREVEKLARLHRDFGRLLCNYVSFTDFYARRGAIFQAGTLYLDARALDLCFHVNDAGKHAALAVMARTCLAYVDCTRPGGEKMTVACAFTAGNSDNLFVGRNGLFIDRKGRDWNATIAKIIDNPISIGQAFWSPYKKVMRWIEESVAKRAAAADEASTAKLQEGAASTGEAAATGQAKAKPKFDIGVVAALGVAVGGITAAFSAFLNAFFGLGMWVPIGVVGLLLAISGPSMIIAWLKLRQRNLGPILDANGWAVNTLTKVNIPLGGSLTKLAHLPPGASRSLVDPYAPKRSIWPRVFFVLLVLAVVAFGLYRFNLLHKWFPDHVPEYVSSSFDGPTEATAGVDQVEVRLGSGAGSVAMKVGDVVTLLPVTATRIVVPTKGLAAGAVVTLVDDSKGKGITHVIRIVPEPQKK